MSDTTKKTVPNLIFTGNIDSIIDKLNACNINQPFDQLRKYDFIKLTNNGVAQFTFTSLIVNIPTGTNVYTFAAIPYTTVSLTHDNNISITGYDFKDGNDRNQLFNTQFIQYFGTIPYIFADGTVRKMISSDEELKLKGKFRPKTEIVDECYCGSIYDHNVSVIQKDHQMDHFCRNWTRDYVIETYPPCIDVSVEKDKYEEFKQWLKQKYGIECDFSLKPIHKTVETSAADIQKECAENLLEQLKTYEHYISSGLYRPI